MRRVHGVAAFHESPLTGNLLINSRLVLAEFSSIGMDEQVSRGIEMNTHGTGKGQVNHTGIRTRSHREIVLETALGSVIDDIHSRVNLVILHSSIGGYACKLTP